MIKLFSLKQEKEKEEAAAGGEAAAKKVAPGLIRMQKGTWPLPLFSPAFPHQEPHAPHIARAARGGRAARPTSCGSLEPHPTCARAPPMLLQT